jgi:hypothetical protein
MSENDQLYNDIFLTNNDKKQSNKFLKLTKNLYFILAVSASIFYYYIFLFVKYYLIQCGLKLLDSENYIFKAKFYFIIFQVSYLIFIICFIRLSFQDPGFYSNDYLEVYSLSKYYENYKNYFKKVFTNVEVNVNQMGEYEVDIKSSCDSENR